ncbi:MAG: hypothetical protein ACYTFA_15635, partial [Planctomycetota bacterium]
MTDSAATNEAKTGATPAKAARPRRMPTVEQLRGRQLGRILIKMGKLRRAQVEEALEIQKEQRGPIGQILVELGYITEEDLNFARAAQSGMESADIAKMDIPAEVVSLMSAQMASTYGVVPLYFHAQQNLLTLAMHTPEYFADHKV